MVADPVVSSLTADGGEVRLFAAVVDFVVEVVPPSQAGWHVMVVVAASS